MNQFTKFGYAVMGYAKDPMGLFRMLKRLPYMARLYWGVFWDKRTSWRARLVLLATLVYVISPLDFIPVFLVPGIGLLDDLAVFIYGTRTFISMASPEVIGDHAKVLQNAHSRPSDA